jgi:hypothetical protein
MGSVTVSGGGTAPTPTKNVRVGSFHLGQNTSTTITLNFNPVAAMVTMSNRNDNNFYPTYGYIDRINNQSSNGYLNRVTVTITNNNLTVYYTGGSGSAGQDFIYMAFG